MRFPAVSVATAASCFRPGDRGEKVICRVQVIRFVPAQLGTPAEKSLPKLRVKLGAAERSVNWKVSAITAELLPRITEPKFWADVVCAKKAPGASVAKSSTKRGLNCQNVSLHGDEMWM
jgi:hypothetical protein